MSRIPYSSFDSRNKIVIVKPIRILSFNQNIKMTWIYVFNVGLRKSEIPIYFIASPEQDSMEQVGKVFF